MEFNEFSAVLEHWLAQRSPEPFECWIDDAQARLALLGDGVRCSLEVLDAFDCMAERLLDGILHNGAAGLACGCNGALAIDPDSYCLVLVEWCQASCDSATLLASLEGLANQRATLLSLMNTSAVPAPDDGWLANPDRLSSGV